MQKELGGHQAAHLGPYRVAQSAQDCWVHAGDRWGAWVARSSLSIIPHHSLAGQLLLQVLFHPSFGVKVRHLQWDGPRSFEVGYLTASIPNMGHLQEAFAGQILRSTNILVSLRTVLLHVLRKLDVRSPRHTQYLNGIPNLAPIGQQYCHKNPAWQYQHLMCQQATHRLASIHGLQDTLGGLLSWLQSAPHKVTHACSGKKGAQMGQVHDGLASAGLQQLSELA